MKLSIEKFKEIELLMKRISKGPLFSHEGTIFDFYAKDRALVVSESSNTSKKEGIVKIFDTKEGFNLMHTALVKDYMDYIEEECFIVGLKKKSEMTLDEIKYYEKNQISFKRRNLVVRKRRRNGPDRIVIQQEATRIILHLNHLFAVTEHAKDKDIFDLDGTKCVIGHFDERRRLFDYEVGELTFLEMDYYKPKYVESDYQEFLPIERTDETYNIMSLYIPLPVRREDKKIVFPKFYFVNDEEDERVFSYVYFTYVTEKDDEGKQNQFLFDLFSEKGIPENLMFYMKRDFYLFDDFLSNLDVNIFLNDEPYPAYQALVDFKNKLITHFQKLLVYNGYIEQFEFEVIIQFYNKGLSFLHDTNTDRESYDRLIQDHPIETAVLESLLPSAKYYMMQNEEDELIDDEKEDQKLVS